MEFSRTRVLEVFKTYTDNYNSSDPKIKLKIDHTYRVADLCEKIAKEENLKSEFGEDVEDLSWLSGMLHDVGRFEQIRQYGTFSDAQSVDHANFGADLLFGSLKDRGVKRLEEYVPLSPDNLFKSFVPDYEKCMSKKQVFLLELAVRNHSLYRIQSGLSQEETMYCNVLRDADKIDIFRVNFDTPLEDIYNASKEEILNSSVSPEVKKAFDEKHAVLRALKHTPVDNVVGHISLYFELVYPVSREIARQQGYLKKLLEFTSDNEETNKWFKYMRQQFDSE